MSTPIFFEHFRELDQYVLRFFPTCWRQHSSLRIKREEDGNDLEIEQNLATITIDQGQLQMLLLDERDYSRMVPIFKAAFDTFMERYPVEYPVNPTVMVQLDC